MNRIMNGKRRRKSLHALSYCIRTILVWLYIKQKKKKEGTLRIELVRPLQSVWMIRCRLCRVNRRSAGWWIMKPIGGVQFPPWFKGTLSQTFYSLISDDYIERYWRHSLLFWTGALPDIIPHARTHTHAHRQTHAQLSHTHKHTHTHTQTHT